MKWAKVGRKGSKLPGTISIQTGTDKSVSLLKGKSSLPKDWKLSSVGTPRIYIRKWDMVASPSASHGVTLNLLGEEATREYSTFLFTHQFSLVLTGYLVCFS